eukprot:357363_1
MSSQEIDFNNITGDTINTILDEIETQEQKTVDTINQRKINNDINWENLLNEMRNGNIGFIKNLITSKDIDINAQNPSNGKTILIYSVIIANIDLVRVCCNYGASVHIKDNDNLDALDYSNNFGNYKITELVYYQQLSGSLGKDLKNIASKIHQKNKQAEMVKTFEIGSYDFLFNNKHNQLLGKGIIEYMMKAIAKRSEFGQDKNLTSLSLLICYISKKPFKTKLWERMMKTFEKILSDTSDKKGWDWLKTHFINSLIWFLPHPNYDSEDIINDLEDNGDMENMLRSILFYELLIRVRAESKKQSDLLLKEKINKIQLGKPKEWK